MNVSGCAPGMTAIRERRLAACRGMIAAGSAWTISFLRLIFQKSMVALVPAIGSKIKPSV